MGSQTTFHSSDLESPGYEYLRSYGAMSNLYYKLVALNYQKEFCLLYKCPPINKFYFALASVNQMEQQFSFMCLSVWLIKDKCQMNFETDPRDYQDLDSTTNVIFEALRLLLNLDDKRQASDERVLFPAGRLKQGYGPEVIYCLNKFADRALEFLLEAEPKLGQVEIIYHSREKGGRDHQARNSIVIGQPTVGGGLTTRPLGNYQMNDASLVFDPDGLTPINDDKIDEDQQEDAGEWLEDKLDKIAPLFELELDEQAPNWADFLGAVQAARAELNEFMSHSRPALEVVSLRVERQMSVIGKREETLNVNFKEQIAALLRAWQEHHELAAKNVELTKQIDHKTDTFERQVEQLRELRIKKVKLNDESKLHELERLTKKLIRQTREMDLKLGLMLASLNRTSRSLAPAANVL